MLSTIFKNKIANFEKLLAFGFTEKDSLYTYSVNIVDEQFRFAIDVTPDGKIKSNVIDNDTGDVYVLHLTNAVGVFVGKVRTDYQNVLEEIVDKCFDNNVFKSEYTHKIISYVRDKYQDELEFLWQRSPNNAIFRRKDNKKWYAAILTITEDKLGLSGKKEIEIIDLRTNPTTIEADIDGKKIFSGYHMNKKHWITICLDGSVSLEEIYDRIDSSYILAKK